MPVTVASRLRSNRFTKQTVVGLTLAAAVFGGWVSIHILGVFVLPWHIALLMSPVLISAQCWLSVGLFIVAHDAMHGSLAPFRPRVNRTVGRLVLMVYAGIWYDDLVARHFAHHRAPGTDHDPDFAGDGSFEFWRWYGAFFAEYLTLAQVIRLALGSAVYLVLFHVALPRLLLFWAVPALASALQLFYFGTYLPHRREDVAFGDEHRARSNDYSWTLSLLSCFHFGYHHEHHDEPSVPWWLLPATRAAKSAQTRA